MPACNGDVDCGVALQDYHGMTIEATTKEVSPTLHDESLSLFLEYRLVRLSGSVSSSSPIVPLVFLPGRSLSVQAMLGDAVHFGSEMVS
jgi:hypothetical protein